MLELHCLPLLWSDRWGSSQRHSANTVLLSFQIETTQSCGGKSRPAFRSQLHVYRTPAMRVLLCESFDRTIYFDNWNTILGKKQENLDSSELSDLICGLFRLLSFKVWLKTWDSHAYVFRGRWTGTHSCGRWPHCILSHHKCIWSCPTSVSTSHHARSDWAHICQRKRQTEISQQTNEIYKWPNSKLSGQYIISMPGCLTKAINPC